MVADIAITSLDTLTAFHPATGAYWFTLDELQNASIEQSEDRTEITGKQGRRLNTLKMNKAVTISGTNGLISGGLLEVQTGSTFENKVTDVFWTDYLVVDDGTATTTYKAVGTTGAEITALYLKNSDGTIGEPLEQASAAAAGKFAYAPATKTLSFHTDIADKTEVVVMYHRNITADVLADDSGKLSGKAVLYIDATGEDTCGNVYRVQIYVPRADLYGDLTLEMGDNQAVHSFQADAMSSGCLGGSFFTYTVFGANTADAT